MYMHHLPMVSFQITSGAHVLPLTSGVEDCFAQPSHMSVKIYSESVLRLMVKVLQLIRSSLLSQARCEPKI